MEGVNFRKNIDGLKADHTSQVEVYKFRFEETKRYFQLLFELQIAITGIIVLVFSILFSSGDSLEEFSTVFKVDFLVLLVSSVLLLGERMYEQISLAVSNQENAQKDTLLTNIRFHALALSSSKGDKYNIISDEATELFNKNVAIKSDIESDLTVELIIKKRLNKIQWKFRFFLWLSLVLCIPTLFTFEIFLN